MEALRSVLRSKQQPKILVIGDIILDKFIWGNVDRISPEAPVQVVNVRRENSALGGAANVAHNLAAIGCEVVLLGVAGDDAAGRELKAELKSAGIRTDAMIVDLQRPTTTKTRIMAGSQHVVRIDNEITGSVSADIETKILAYLKKNLSGFDAVIVSDYQKGVLTDNVLLNVIRLAKQKNIPSVVDPKRQDFSLYGGAGLLKPNLKEAEAAVGRKLTTEKDVLDAGREILKKFHPEAVLITRGKDGMMLVEKSGHHVIAASAREVFDVTGAGDTVSAFLGWMLAMKQSLTDAATVANLAAGIAVSHMGTVTVSREEVMHQLDKRSSGSGKIVTADELKALLPAIRKNKKIVFTNGCFDILHVGHITLLNKSKALGDKLIVGLNSDASIRRIKGPKRPIVSEEERAHILSALESVDHVVLFDEDTPLNLLKKLRPDILVKGSDYTLDRVVGRDLVESYGGRVALVDLVPGFSTTNIVQAVLESYGDHKSTDKKLITAQKTMKRIESLQDRFDKKISEKEEKNKKLNMNLIKKKK